MEKINDPTEVKLTVTCQVSPINPEQKFDHTVVRAFVAQAIHDALEHEELNGFYHPMANEICIGIVDVEVVNQNREEHPKHEMTTKEINEMIMDIGG